MKLVKVFVVCVMALCMVSGCAPAGDPAPGRPLAVVLTTEPGLKARLTAVDLESGTVATRVRLRSTAQSMDVDPEKRLVVTSQCGGVSTDADNALGVYDVDRGGPVDYVELEYPNPGIVVHVGGGRMVFDQGMMDSDGLVVGLLDARRREVLRLGRIPDYIGGFDLAGGFLWGMSYSNDREEYELRRIDSDTLESQVVTTAASMGASIVDAGEGRMFAMLSQGRPPRVYVHVRRFDGNAKSLESGGLENLYFEDGPACDAAVIGDVVAVPDFSDMVEPYGTRVLLLSSELDREPVEVPVPGGPAAIKAWGSKFVVLEKYTGRILTIDPMTAAVEVVAELGEAEGGWHSDMAILP